MDYKDAIAYLKENDIRKEDGTFYEFGEVNIEDVMTLDLHVHVHVGISLRNFFRIKNALSLDTVMSSLRVIAGHP